MQIRVSQVPKTYFYSLPAINLRPKVFTKLYDSSLKNTKFSSLWGGHIPPQTPRYLYVYEGIHLCDAHQKKKANIRIYAPG